MSWEYCSDGWCAAREVSALGGRVLLERHNRTSKRYDHVCILPDLTESEFNQAVTALIGDSYGIHAFFAKGASHENVRNPKEENRRDRRTAYRLWLGVVDLLRRASSQSLCRCLHDG